MRQEIGLDVIFHERLELFDDKQFVDACGKLTDPVERQRIGEANLEHPSGELQLLQSVDDIVERAACGNDPHRPPDTHVDDMVKRRRFAEKPGLCKFAQQLHMHFRRVGGHRHEP